MKRKRRRWSVAEKKRLAGQARKLRAQGETFAGICERLDVLEGSLRLWMQQYPESTIREVSVAPEPLKTSSCISVTTPDGLRFEGLEIDDVIVLLEVRI